jgi:two-component system response regulator AtoC
MVQQNFHSIAWIHTIPLASNRAEMQTMHKYQILVVDDEPSVCRSIKMLLEHDGHKVQTANSGEAALAMFEQDKFDLVMTDYIMEKMKGVQLACLIKQRQPDQPIIMVTAFANELDLHGKPSEVVDFIISKPFSQKALRDAIVQVMLPKESKSNASCGLYAACP